jgi:hypothetical protein
MALGLMHRFREPLTVAVVAFAAAISITGANAAYIRYASAHPGYPDTLLVLVSKPVILLASLNKTLLAIALHPLNNPDIEDWMRGAMMLGALFGIGTGTLAGIYLLLWIYGTAITQGGDAFGWGILRFFKKACVVVCAAYILFGIWQLVQYRQSLDADILGNSVGSAVGLFALAVVEFSFLGVVGYYGYAAAKGWHRARNLKR